MPKSKGGRKIGNPAARARATEEPIVIEARRHLAGLDAAPRSYELVYYAVDPEELSNDLDVPIDGGLHAHSSVIGMTLHLDESRRRPSMETASRGFTGPFVAVLRNPEHVATPVDHATILQGANLYSEMLVNPLRVIQVEHRIEALHFGALLAMGANDGEWMAAGPEEMQGIVTDFQLRVEAESVLVAGRIMARRSL